MNKVKKALFIIMALVGSLSFLDLSAHASQKNKCMAQSHKVNRQFNQNQQRHRDKLERMRTKDYQYYSKIKVLQIQPSMNPDAPFFLFLKTLQLMSRIRIKYSQDSNVAREDTTSAVRTEKLFDAQTNEEFVVDRPYHIPVYSSGTICEDEPRH